MKRASPTLVLININGPLELDERVKLLTPQYTRVTDTHREIWIDLEYSDVDNFSPFVGHIYLIYLMAAGFIHATCADWCPQQCHVDPRIRVLGHARIRGVIENVRWIVGHVWNDSVRARCSFLEQLRPGLRGSNGFIGSQVVVR